jgi:hypothetical protein
VPITAKRDLRIIGTRFSPQRKLLLNIADITQHAGAGPTTVSNLGQGEAMHSDSPLGITRVRSRTCISPWFSVLICMISLSQPYHPCSS